jgi:hypothetical protein
VSEVLAEAIAAGPVGELTFIVGERGRPLVKEVFGAIFRVWCDAAGVDKSAHGVRKTAATADALAGYSEAELSAKFGWTGRGMPLLYTRTVNREKLSLAAAERVKVGTKSPAPRPDGAGTRAGNSNESMAKNPPSVPRRDGMFPAPLACGRAQPPRRVSL